MRVLVSGSSGLVGSALVRGLETDGHTAVRLVRRRALHPGECAWDPEQGTIEAAKLEGLDAAVHLAGENIASGRWTSARKTRIRDSRAKGTALLSGVLAACTHKPEVLVSASAIGYYGNRGEEEVNEDSPPGTGFLAEVCRDWEAASQSAGLAGIRVVNLRIGLVLSGEGGALAKMLPIFRLGLGGPLGNGRTCMSWITLEDLVGIVRFAIEHKNLSGPVNAVAPHAVSNWEFSKTLAKVLRRPAWFPVPALLIRAALGEMGQALLLDGARVLPGRLTENGYTFRHPDLEGALRAVL